MFVPGKSIPILLLLILLGGCAKPPREELQAARMAVAQAGYMDAARWAPEEFLRASETLREGEELLRQRDYELASVILPRARELARQAILRAEEEKLAFARLQEIKPQPESPPPPPAAPQPAPAPAKTKPKPAVERPVPPPLPARITVEGTQTLWLIAARKDVYDDPLLWPLLYQANRDQIRDPRQIHPGQVLKVPRDISRREREEAREKARRSEIFAEYRMLRGQSPRRSQQ